MQIDCNPDSDPDLISETKSDMRTAISDSLPRSAQSAAGRMELTIGQASEAVGLPTKTVRYYADIGLVVPSGRSASGYRQYGQSELQKLRFVRRARSFGFSVEACRELLSLYQDDGRASREVKGIALRRLREIEEKMLELQQLHDDLSYVANNCRGDDTPECPILENLAQAQSL